MPVRADFAVVMDACVLAEASVADLYLRLSEEPRLLLPKWTERIWNETTKTCVDKLGWSPDTAQRRRVRATESFPEALVEGYEHLEAVCENHEEDRHVLAAAIHEKVETVVTTNLKHFPAAALEQWGIVAAHPGQYLITLYEHDSGVVVDKLHRIAADRRKSFAEVLGRLAWCIPTFSAHVGESLNIEVPEVTSANWRTKT